MEHYNIIGILAIKDSVRRDARFSVKTVQNAGIYVCMVTGDNADTAKAVAESCGILTPDAVTLTSSEMALLSDSELAELLPRLKVVSRALPADKSRLARVSQSAGLVCGMTGDGINDAPALKRADVGFAMGSGTEVAKQAGDIVILDDNFTSISKSDTLRQNNFQKHTQIYCIPADNESLRRRNIYNRTVYRRRYARYRNADAVDQYYNGYPGRTCVCRESRR